MLGNPRLINLAVIEKRSFKIRSFEKKVCRRDIRDFQNAVTFLFKEIDRKFTTLLKALDLKYLHIKSNKVLTKMT